MNRQQRRANMKLLMPSRAATAAKQREGVMVHKMIEERAKDMAAMFYEQAAGKANNFYAAFPNLKDFVASQWPDFIGHTKQALTQLLKPEFHYKTTEEQRELIYDALCLDRSLPKSQSRGLN